MPAIDNAVFTEELFSICLYVKKNNIKTLRRSTIPPKTRLKPCVS